MHLQQQPNIQRTTAGATRSTSSQRADTATATRSAKKSGFTLASPAIAAQEIEGEGDSDEWVSSESLSVTPLNQSSDSESSDEDDNLPDDREPPTPTVPQVKMLPPTPVNHVKQEPSQRLSAAPALNEARRTSLVDVDKGRSTANDHQPRPEDGFASTPRPRAMADRTTEPSRHLSPAPHPHPSLGPDSTARKPPAANPSLNGAVQSRSQQPTLSVHPVPESRPRITSDPSPNSRANNNLQGPDQTTMTQVSEDPPIRITSKASMF